jgi:hypothetical protein
MKLDLLIDELEECERQVAKWRGKYNRTVRELERLRNLPDALGIGDFEDVEDALCKMADRVKELTSD